MIHRVLLTLSLALLAACAVAPARVELRFPANGAPMNEYFALDIAVEGEPPDRIEVDADMPGHKHGMASTPIVHAISPGRYRVEGMLFHMAGAWEVYVEVVRGDRRDRQTFPIEVEP